MATSIASALEWWARTKGDTDALVFADGPVSYRALRDWSGRIARRLADSGVAAGDRVALMGGNTAEWAAAAFGVIKAGAVLIPLSPRLVAAELHTLLTTSDATVVIADGAFDATLKEVADLGAGFTVVDLAGLGELRDGGPEPFRVERDSCHTHTSQAERGASERKARILHPSFHFFKLKPANRDTEGTGKSGRYEHLRRIAPNAAGYA